MIAVGDQGQGRRAHLLQFGLSGGPALAALEPLADQGADGLGIEVAEGIGRIGPLAQGGVAVTDVFRFPRREWRVIRYEIAADVRLLDGALPWHS